MMVSCVIVRLYANMSFPLGRGICGEGRPVHVNPPNSLYIDKLKLIPFHQTLTNKPFLDISQELTQPNPTPNPLTSTLACTHPRLHLT